MVSNKDEVVNKAKEIHKELLKNFTCTFDASGSIGRRYSRADEMGVVACITIDFDTLKDDSVTIRDRDTTKQERVKISELNEVLKKMICPV